MQPKIHKSKISNTEWGIALLVMLTIDLIQVILNFFVIGVVVNRGINIAVGILFPLYLQLRGESFVNPKRFLAYLGAIFGEMIPLVDIVPLWSANLVYNYFLAQWRNRDADKQEKEATAAEQAKKKRDQQEQMLRLNAIRQRQQQEQEGKEALERERAAQEDYERREREIGQRTNQEEYEHLMNMGRMQNSQPQTGRQSSSRSNPNDVALPS